MIKNSEGWVVSFKEEGMRLVNYIKLKTNVDLSLRQIKSLLEKGICKVNSSVETFASKKLKKGDLVQLEKSWERTRNDSANAVSAKPPKILYEDEYLFVINKPVGFLCADSEVQRYFPGAILVHRLDKQTSGALILAKSTQAKNRMKSLFNDKEVHKTYISVVEGRVLEKSFKRESFLVRRKDSEGKILWKETTANGGIYSLSLFETLKSRKTYSVLKCFPITGRTHQLRVHLLSSGHPILGDFQYFREFKYLKFVPRLMLHSYQIEFTHPFTNRKINVISYLPKEFKSFIEKIQ